MAFLPIPIPKGGKGKRGRDHVDDARNVRQNLGTKMVSPSLKIGPVHTVCIPNFACSRLQRLRLCLRT
jgi:hypothetical protein